MSDAAAENSVQAKATIDQVSQVTDLVPAVDAIGSKRVGSTRSDRYTVTDLSGIVPALPGGETDDFEDLIEEAMQAEADRLMTHLALS